MTAHPVHVTNLAVQRYRHRVADLPDAAVIDLLAGNRAVQLAASVGAPFVRLGSGHRVVLCRNRVVNVLHPQPPRANLMLHSADYYHG